jgi:hypothetical protein
MRPAFKREERDMKRKRAERAAQQAKSAVEDAFGLPPVKKTPHDTDGPPRDPNAPSGSLSSDGEELIPVVFGIPTKPE